MATPVPVVSMIYSFVFSPPKMTGVVRPAFCAVSVKCAMSLAFVFRESTGTALGGAAACRNSQAQGPSRQASRTNERSEERRVGKECRSRGGGKDVTYNGRER